MNTRFNNISLQQTVKHVIEKYLIREIRQRLITAFNKKIYILHKILSSVIHVVCIYGTCIRSGGNVCEAIVRD